MKRIFFVMMLFGVFSAHADNNNTAPSKKAVPKVVAIDQQSSLVTVDCGDGRILSGTGFDAAFGLCKKR